MERFQHFSDNAGMDVLKIAGFDRGVLLTVADLKGFLTAENLRITFDQVSNSTMEISGLLDGKWDVAFDNGDNVVAWNQGFGADGRPHDFFIFMGGSAELEQDLFVTPDIGTVEDLRGKLLGADAIGTGFAVVLRYILDSHGLAFPRDYEFKPVGSTRIRLAELEARRISGAMLNPRYIEESGSDLHRLARGRDYAKPYPARVGLTTRHWAAAHRSLLVRFIAAMIRAIDWLSDSRNEFEAIALIGSEQNRSGARAEKVYRRLLEPAGDLFNRDAFVRETLSTVLEIRRKLGLIGSPLPAFDQFHDESYYRQALSLAEAR